MAAYSRRGSNVTFSRCYRRECTGGANCGMMANMPKPLISLVMMVKDEAASIVASIESCRPFVDRIVILDTGSTDGTQKLARGAAGDVSFELYEEPFVDYGSTRNRALFLAGEETVFTIMLSGDETLERGDALRSFCESVRTMPMPAFLLEVDFGEQCIYASTRLARAGSGWRYVGRVHEVMVGPEGEAADMVVPDARIRHRKSCTSGQDKRKWERDLELLLADHQSEPTNPRTVFYLAQTYQCLGKLEKASKFYARRAQMQGWSEETYMALFRRAECRELMGDVGAARLGFLQAHSASPERAEPLYRIALSYYKEQEHHLTYLFAKRASELPMPTGLRLFLNPTVYAYGAHDLVATSAFYVGERAAGIRSGCRALRAAPGDERVAKNLSFYFGPPTSQESMSHAVVVIGTGRSGTSAVAGMLDAWGIPMGEHLLPPDPANPGGYFEDEPLVALDEALLAGSRVGALTLRAYLRWRAQRSRVWGAKDPRLVHVWDTWRELLPCPVTVVHVERELEDCVRSCLRAYGGNRNDWERLMLQRQEAARRIANAHRAVRVRYEHLLHDPRKYLGLLLDRLPRFARDAVQHQARWETAVETITKRAH